MCGFISECSGQAAARTPVSCLHGAVTLSSRMAAEAIGKGRGETRAAEGEKGGERRGKEWDERNRRGECQRKRRGGREGKKERRATGRKEHRRSTGHS